MDPVGIATQLIALYSHIHKAVRIKRDAIKTTLFKRQAPVVQCLTYINLFVTHTHKKPQYEVFLYDSEHAIGGHFVIGVYKLYFPRLSVKDKRNTGLPLWYPV
jgi:hypothetical protein